MPLDTHRQTLRSWRMLGPPASAPFVGDGRGPAVLALHGFTGTPSELGPLLPALVASGRAVRAPLLPGHGTCPTRLAESTFDAWLDAARAEADALEARYGSLVLVGFSLGSLVALSLAAERGATLRGVVALAPPLHLRRTLRYPLLTLGRLGRVPDLYLRKLAAAQRLFGPQTPVTTYDRDPLRAAVEVARGGVRTRALLPRVRAPLLALHGKGDALCPPSNLATLLRTVGSSDRATKLYTCSTHVLLADRERDVVARDIVAFLDRVAPLA